MLPTELKRRFGEGHETQQPMKARSNHPHATIGNSAINLILSGSTS
ncbi:hypothetical protein [Dactylococcopsis salina]|nr:hypothetical protein [Dactylococcopsis salina]